VLVLVATRLRRVLMRPEDYYESKQAVGEEKYTQRDDIQSNDIQVNDSQGTSTQENNNQARANLKTKRKNGDQNVDD